MAPAPGDNSDLWAPRLRLRNTGYYIFYVFHTCLFWCQDLDQFMREMEEVHRQREAEKAASLQQRLSRSVASLPSESSFSLLGVGTIAGPDRTPVLAVALPSLPTPVPPPPSPPDPRN